MEGPVLTAYQSSPPKKGNNFLFTKSCLSSHLEMRSELKKTVLGTCFYYCCYYYHIHCDYWKLVHLIKLICNILNTKLIKHEFSNYNFV